MGINVLLQHERVHRHKRGGFGAVLCYPHCFQGFCDTEDVCLCSRGSSVPFICDESFKSRAKHAQMALAAPAPHGHGRGTAKLAWKRFLSNSKTEKCGGLVLFVCFPWEKIKAIHLLMIQL